MALDLQLGAGSFTGHVITVDLDVAYTPDVLDSSPLTGTSAIYFDEDAVSIVEATIMKGGVYTPGTGVVFWPRQSLPAGGTFTKFLASFQWIDFNQPQAWFTGTWVSDGAGPDGSDQLPVSRPTVVRGLELD